MLPVPRAYELTYDDQALWERGDLSLSGVYAAWRERHDPRLAEYIIKLAQLDPQPKGYEEAQKSKQLTYDQMLNELRPWRMRRSIRDLYVSKGGQYAFGKLSRKLLRECIQELHQAQWALLEASSAPTPDRLKLHEVIIDLWESAEPFAREALLKVLRYVPLKWGPWKAIRHIFKASLRKRDWEVFALLSVRLEVERLTGREGAGSPARPFSVSWNKQSRDVSARTLAYLQRYAWRALRLIAKSQPSLYPEVAALVLKQYPSLPAYQLNSSWLYNHLLFHNAPPSSRRSKRVYGAERFYFYARDDYHTHRAYPELWTARPEPLLGLLEGARQEGVSQFATQGLLKDFRDHLKTLNAAWVSRVASYQRAPLDAFLATWFSELCPHAQADYEREGLHLPLLTLLWSSDKAMKSFALSYFKAHLSVLTRLVTPEQVMGFAQSEHSDLRALAEELLNPEHPHVQLSFDQWTTLLERKHSHSFAAKAFKRLYSAKDMSFEWFARLLNAELDEAARFALSLLKDPNYQPEGGDLLGFYWQLLTPKSWRSKTAQIAFEGLETEVVEQGEAGARLLHQLSKARLWALLLHPESAGRDALKRWVKKGWLSPAVFGVEALKLALDEERWSSQWWLAQLTYEAASNEEGSEEGADEGAAWRYEATYPYNLDGLTQEWLLGGAFKPEELGLEWLLERALSGDWSDRAYKQFAFKRLDMKHFSVLSEASKGKPSASAGVEAIFERLCATSDYSERNLLIELLKERHPATLLAGDPNKKQPPAKRLLSNELLSFERFEQLARHSESSLRELALYFARFELGRWTTEAPLTFARLLPFFMGGAEEVRAALLKAMTKPRDADERIDVRLEQFEANELYAFCFSPRAQVRDLGLSLIATYPDRFLDPAQLALLAESSDRRVCEGVVKALYASLRFKEVSAPWQPTAESVAPRSEVAKRQAELVVAQPPKGKHPSEVKSKRYLGEGSQVPSGVDPSAAAWTVDFLRRTVFRLSPGHPFKEDLSRLTPTTSAWRNKVSLIKALRDLATQHAEFAQLITPILTELMGSRGRAERDACLVALARIRHAHPNLTA